MFTFSVAIPIFSKKERLPSSRFSASSLIGAARTTTDFQHGLAHSPVDSRDVGCDKRTVDQQREQLKAVRHSEWHDLLQLWIALDLDHPAHELPTQTSSCKPIAVISNTGCCSCKAVEPPRSCTCVNGIEVLLSGFSTAQTFEMSSGAAWASGAMVCNTRSGLAAAWCCWKRLRRRATRSGLHAPG